MRFSRIVLLLLGVVFIGIPGMVYLLRPPVRIKSLRLAEKVPLAAEAKIQSRRPSRVTLRIKGRNGAEDLQVSFEEEARVHHIPVLGLYPDWENSIEFRITDDKGRVHRLNRTLTTDALPEEYPEIVVRTPLPEKTAPGMLFMHLGHYDNRMRYTPYPSAIDDAGEVRWLYAGDNGHLLRRLENGNLMIQEDDSIVEVDMLGRPEGGRWEIVPRDLHHDAVEMPNGDFLALSSAEDSIDDEVVLLDRETGVVLKRWDFRQILDPERPVMPANLNPKDWLHLNGIVYDSQDDSMIVSGRDQSALVKVDIASGSIVWILGNHDKWKEGFKPFLLQPVGDSFEWSWGQHAPMLHPDDSSRILLFDNGNERSYDEPRIPEENYSRIVEYQIDPGKGTVRQIWQYGRERGSELFAPFIGDADYLSNGNRLACFGGITRDREGRAMELFDFENDKVNMMKVSAHIIELTDESPARIVREVILADDDASTYEGYRSYRAEKMSLYP